LNSSRCGDNQKRIYRTDKKSFSVHFPPTFIHLKKCCLTFAESNLNWRKFVYLSVPDGSDFILRLGDLVRRSICYCIKNHLKVRFFSSWNESKKLSEENNRSQIKVLEKEKNFFFFCLHPFKDYFSLYFETSMHHFDNLLMANGFSYPSDLLKDSFSLFQSNSIKTYKSCYLMSLWINSSHFLFPSKKRT